MIQFSIATTKRNLPDVLEALQKIESDHFEAIAEEQEENKARDEYAVNL